MKPYYQDRFCEIYHGDCKEILPSLGQFDLLLTDPPYGIGASSKKFINGTSASKKDYYLDICWDAKPVEKDILDLGISHALKSIIWGGNYFDLPPHRCFLIWDKTIHGNSYADCEMAWTSLDKVSRIIPVNMVEANKDGRVHPTQKPVKLWKWCIVQAGEGIKTILDPFAGSGTSGEAAAKMGLHATMIEQVEREGG